MVGKTWTVSMMSSMVSLNLTASTASWIMSAAFSARIWTPRILPLVLSSHHFDESSGVSYRNGLWDLRHLNSPACAFVAFLVGFLVCEAY